MSKESAILHIQMMSQVDSPVGSYFSAFMNARKAANTEAIKYRLDAMDPGPYEKMADMLATERMRLQRYGYRSSPKSKTKGKGPGHDALKYVSIITGERRSELSQEKTLAAYTWRAEQEHGGWAERKVARNSDMDKAGQGAAPQNQKALAMSFSPKNYVNNILGRGFTEAQTIAVLKDLYDQADQAGREDWIEEIESRNIVGKNGISKRFEELYTRGPEFQKHLDEQMARIPSIGKMQPGEATLIQAHQLAMKDALMRGYSKEDYKSVFHKQAYNDEGMKGENLLQISEDEKRAPQVPGLDAHIKRLTEQEESYRQKAQEYRLGRASMAGKMFASIYKPVYYEEDLQQKEAVGKVMGFAEAKPTHFENIYEDIGPGRFPDLKLKGYGKDVEKVSEAASGMREGGATMADIEAKLKNQRGFWGTEAQGIRYAPDIGEVGVGAFEGFDSDRYSDLNRSAKNVFGSIYTKAQEAGQSMREGDKDEALKALDSISGMVRFAARSPKAALIMSKDSAAFDAMKRIENTSKSVIYREFMHKGSTYRQYQDGSFHKVVEDVENQVDEPALEVELRKAAKGLGKSGMTEALSDERAKYGRNPDRIDEGRFQADVEALSKFSGSQLNEDINFGIVLDEALGGIMDRAQSPTEKSMSDMNAIALGLFKTDFDKLGPEEKKAVSHRYYVHGVRQLVSDVSQIPDMAGKWSDMLPKRVDVWNEAESLQAMGADIEAIRKGSADTLGHQAPEVTLAPAPAAAPAAEETPAAEEEPAPTPAPEDKAARERAEEEAKYLAEDEDDDLGDFDFKVEAEETLTAEEAPAPAPAAEVTPAPTLAPEDKAEDKTEEVDEWPFEGTSFAPPDDPEAEAVEQLFGQAQEDDLEAWEEEELLRAVREVADQAEKRQADERAKERAKKEAQYLKSADEDEDFGDFNFGDDPPVLEEFKAPSLDEKYRPDTRAASKDLETLERQRALGVVSPRVVDVQDEDALEKARLEAELTADYGPIDLEKHLDDFAEEHPFDEFERMLQEMEIEPIKDMAYYGLKSFGLETDEATGNPYLFATMTPDIGGIDVEISEGEGRESVLPTAVVEIEGEKYYIQTAEPDGHPKDWSWYVVDDSGAFEPIEISEHGKALRPWVEQNILSPGEHPFYGKEGAPSQQDRLKAFTELGASSITKGVTIDGPPGSNYRMLAPNISSDGRNVLQSRPMYIEGGQYYVETDQPGKELPSWVIVDNKTKEPITGDEDQAVRGVLLEWKYDHNWDPFAGTWKQSD